MILFVDPCEKLIKIKLLDDSAKEVCAAKLSSSGNQTELLVKRVDELLGGCGYELSDIKKIVTLRGPGSYTGLRVVLSTLNAIAYALDVPIFGYKMGEMSPEDFVEDNSMGFKQSVSPYYVAPPKITKPKS